MSDEIKTTEETPVATETPSVTATPAAEEPKAPAPTEEYRKPYQRGEGGRGSKFRKKVCRFCHDKDLPLDYKRSDILERFITDRGKILPRRVTGTCAKHQRLVAREIKRARIIALVPFVEK